MSRPNHLVARMAFLCRRAKAGSLRALARLTAVSEIPERVTKQGGSGIRLPAFVPRGQEHGGLCYEARPLIPATEPEPRPVGDDTMTTPIASLPRPGDGIAGSLSEPATALAGDVLALVAELSDEVSQLKVALHSNRRIGMAMGLIMAQFGVADDEAFDALRTISQNTNRKLRDVADDVITRRRI
jgi:hypothetical protein